MAQANLTEIQEQHYFQTVEFFRVANGWSKMEFIEQLAGLSEQMQPMKLADFKNLEPDEEEQDRVQQVSENEYCRS